jgi:DNA-binding CsgD family transcriptional regulator
MELVERDEAASTLGSLLERSLSGVSGVAVVDGPLGSGKTTVLQAFAQHCVKEGALFLNATASRAEVHIVLGVIDQLLHGVRVPTPAVERMVDLLVDNGSVLPDMAGHRAQQVPVPVLRAMCGAVRELAAEQPVVIAVDDAHYMDPASLQCLLHLIHRLRSDPVLVVLGASLHSSRVRCLFDADILRLPNCHRVVLPPLSGHGVAELLSRQLDRETALALAEGFRQVSGGNPLLVSALADDYLSAPAVDARKPVIGDSFGRAVLCCLYRGEPLLLDVARAVAMLGESASSRLVARLLEMPPDTVERAFDELAVAGLVDAARRCLEQARAAVLDGMPPGERKAMHHRAARLLNESGAPSIRVAEHLVAMEQAEPWAVPVLREAAGQVLSEGRVEIAVSYLQLAHQASVDERERALTISALNSAVWLVNPGATKRHLPELTAAIRAGNLTGWHGALTFGHLLWHGRIADACELLSLLDCREGAAPHRIDGAGIDRMRLWLPYLYPGLASYLGAEQMTADVAKLPLTAAWAPHLRAASALNTTLTGTADADVVAEAEQVLRGTVHGDGALAPVLAALAVLFYADRLDKAIAWCDSLPARTGADFGLASNALFGLVRSAIRYRQGDLVEAEARGREALALLSPAGWGVAVAAPLAFLILTATAMGRYEDAIEYLKVPVPPAAFETLCGPHYLSARGQFYLATGAVDAALHDFHASGELVKCWGFDAPGFVSWRTDVAQAYLCRAESRHPTTLIGEQLARLRPGRSRTRGITLRAQAATLDLPQRVPLLRDAADNFQFCGDRLNLAYTLADLSRAHHVLGEQRVADALTRRASELAERCGAEPLARALAPMVDATHAGGAVEPPPLAMLSDAERKVAVLAADGHTNRQIANKLYITVSTVEQHLTRVYRKLAVNRRSELPIRLGPECAGSGEAYA